MRDRALLIVGIGAIALSLIGSTFFGGAGMGFGWGWGGNGYMDGYPGGYMGPGMMGQWWGSSGVTQGAAPIEGAREVDITLNDFEIVPDVITVAAGEAVNLTVTNVGAAPHDFSVPDLGIHVVVAPGETATVGMTASVRGTYDTLCTIPGHASLGMVGTLTVE